MSEAAKKPYPELLAETVTGPLGLSDTTFVLTDDQKSRLMQGHGFDGKALPDVPTGDVIVGSGGLYSTPNDLLRWMQWHLDRLRTEGAEARMLDHAAYLVREGSNPVSGMDESGHMDAMSLAWVGDDAGRRPAADLAEGGRACRARSCYIAFAPTRGIAVFVVHQQVRFRRGDGHGPSRQRDDRSAWPRARRHGRRLLPR